MLDNCTHSDKDTARVLIVDDEPNMARAIQRTLKAAGFDTIVATSGLEAGIYLHYSAPDVITLDMRMPDVDGRELLNFMRGLDDYANVKILVVTGMSDQDLLLLDLGNVDGVLQKPFDNDELVEKVTALAVR